ncbi:hypothetical protein M9434_005884 [Picochlorum sp. BPE23]|nr:hypothetical protein M9434_005884 [Picochlorum sp. BPE23]KAI8103630.1 hypothetical protein M9435_004965 [Picochlorum sp. BPE23]|eukprot:jgi/Picre1/30126/NNA_005495.t1
MLQSVLRRSSQVVLRHGAFSGTATGAVEPCASVLLARQHAFSTDTHDDFKPKIKTDNVSGSVDDVIDADVTSHKVFLYMKGVPEAPMCGFSNMACRILDAHNIQYGSRDVLSDPELREGIKKYTSWPTIPQVFIGGEFVGGSDILLDMHQSGELKKALDALFSE